ELRRSRWTVAGALRAGHRGRGAAPRARLARRRGAALEGAGPEPRRLFGLRRYRAGCAAERARRTTGLRRRPRSGCLRPRERARCAAVWLRDASDRGCDAAGGPGSRRARAGRDARDGRRLRAGRPRRRQVGQGGMAVQEHVSALFTDLYEVTMAQAYLREGMSGTAVFETFFRKLPPGRSYVLAAGIGDVLDFLEDLRFERADLEYLRGLGSFSEEFLERLARLRFTGDVWAVPEGTIVFPNEPIVQIAAPIFEAQLVETFVINQIHLQSVLASKAARVVTAARGRTVVEFGARRAHGTDAALKAARTSYLAGAAGTSNLFAARQYGIPAFGTMAHSFVQAFEDEADAFEAFARLYPGTTLLVDTYDTLRGIDRVVELARRLGTGFDLGAVRLDSGDLGALAREARARLDRAGLGRTQIFASSSLDE